MIEIDKAVFYRELRGRDKLFGSRIEQTEVDGTEAILDAMEGTPISHRAYALATAYHETNKTMQPVREAYWLSENWRRHHLRYWPWYGRGFVQLTWEFNYRRADRELGLGGQLLANPDMAMDIPIAAKIMRRGMEEGWFVAGHTLKRHCPDEFARLEQFECARQIINGMDRAQLVASYAMQFQEALREAVAITVEGRMA